MTELVTAVSSYLGSVLSRVLTKCVRSALWWHSHTDYAPLLSACVDLEVWPCLRLLFRFCASWCSKMDTEALGMSRTLVSCCLSFCGHRHSHIARRNIGNVLDHSREPIQKCCLCLGIGKYLLVVWTRRSLSSTKLTPISRAQSHSKNSRKVRSALVLCARAALCQHLSRDVQVHNPSLSSCISGMPSGSILFLWFMPPGVHCFIITSCDNRPKFLGVVIKLQRLIKNRFAVWRGSPASVLLHHLLLPPVASVPCFWKYASCGTLSQLDLFVDLSQLGLFVDPTALASGGGRGLQRQVARVFCSHTSISVVLWFFSSCKPPTLDLDTHLPNFAHKLTSPSLRSTFSHESGNRMYLVCMHSYRPTPPQDHARQKLAIRISKRIPRPRNGRRRVERGTHDMCSKFLTIVLACYVFNACFSCRV